MAPSENEFDLPAIMSQCRLIDCNKCAAPLGDADDGEAVAM